MSGSCNALLTGDRTPITDLKCRSDTGDRLAITQLARIEVRPRLKGEHAADMAVVGQAVPVDLAPGRTLYTLLRSGSTEDWAGWIVLWLVRTRALADATMADAVRAAASTRPVLTLPARFPEGAGYPLAGTDALPTFVTFADPRRPETVRIVEADAFAATFGPGTTLRRITFKVTDDPVSDTLRARLPWLATQRGSLVAATIQSPPGQRTLSAVTNAAFELRGF